MRVGAFREEGRGVIREGERERIMFFNRNRQTRKIVIINYYVKGGVGLFIFSCIKSGSQFCKAFESNNFT